MMNETHSGVVSALFGPADYAVFVAMLLVSAGIGVYYAISDRKQDATADDILMGGRSMGIFPVAMSLLASFLSAISLLGIPVEAYTFGTMYWTQLAIFPLIIYLTSVHFIPVFYNLGLTSSYEGGMKAVIWTDVFQTIMMFGSMVLVVVKGIYDAGGPSVVIEKAYRTDRLEPFDFRLDPTVRHSTWAVMIGALINWTSVFGTNQAMVQRYLSIPTLAKAQKSVWVVLPLMMTLVSILCTAGLVLYASYDGCDPISTERVSSSDQLFPLFVMDTLGSFPGIPGLFVAGIFSGALSTVSSGVNALAATTLEDFVKGYVCQDLTEKQLTRWTKGIAVFYGLLSIALVAVAERMGNVLTAALALFGLLGAPVLSLFVLGMFFTSTNAKGALWGTLLGLGASMWVGIGGLYYKPYHQQKPLLVTECDAMNVSLSYHFEQSRLDLIAQSKLDANEDIFVLYRISYMYYGLIGCSVTIISGLLISWLTGPEKEINADPMLFIPVVQKRLRKLQTSKIVNSMIGQWKPAINCVNCVQQSKSTYGPEPLSTLQLKISSGKGKKGSPLPVTLNGVINIGFQPETLNQTNLNRHRNYDDLRKADVLDCTQL
ncbi:Sodium-coupled monocarboxylate transporter 1 [Halotydeus destructor]|nr:Sodium-coupled monocarboxylate transporter 1 [Halotydeus destructor]